MSSLNDQQRKLRSAEKSVVSVSPLSGSPAAHISSAKLWDKIEARLEALTKNLTNAIVSQLKTEINTMFNSLSERINKIESDFNAKVTSLEHEINERYSSINHSVFTCKNSVDNAISHCSSIDAFQDELSIIKSQMLENDNTQLKLQIDDLARRNIAGDIVLHGIPTTANENLADIFQQFCTKINMSPLTPIDIIRTEPMRNSPSSAIIVKLPHARSKTILLKKVAEYYKTNAKSITLNDLGFASNKFVRVYESLTKHNHALFRRANELRRNKSIHSVFTRSGRVFIKETAEKRPTCIVNMLSLESLCSGGSN